MKKVLFVISDYELGGTRSSLINLLTLLSTNMDYSLDLFVLAHHGPYCGQMPNNVRVLPEYKIIANCLPKTQKSIYGMAYHLVIYLAKKIFGYKEVLGRIFSQISKKIEQNLGMYDAVIGYQEGISSMCASYISAKQHYIWIHSDVDKWYNNNTFDNCAFDKATKIIFVAEASKNKFITLFPNYYEKCLVIHNTVCAEVLKTKGNISIPKEYKKDKFNFVSVGRIVEAKAFYRVIKAAKLLQNAQIAFDWRIIGDGPLGDTLKKQIKENELDDCVVMMGAHDNPYPYVCRSDLLIVTSINENQPMVILEALSLGVPVLSTRFDSSLEILKDKSYGMVCDNDDNSIGIALMALGKNPEKISAMKNQALTFQPDNSLVLKQFHDLVY